MSDEDWGENPTGYGTEHKNNKNTGMLQNTGCAVTEMSNVVSSASGRDITPKDINNDKSNFAEDTDLLNMQKVAEDNGLKFDYWTKEKQGDLGKKIKENNNSNKKYYISGQVKYDEEGDLHWVGIEDIKVGKDGKSYVKIAPTSVNDTNKNSRRRETWQTDENGDMWVETSDINKIYTYEEK